MPILDILGDALASFNDFSVVNGSGVPLPATTIPAVRDDQVLEAIQAALVATGSFDRVLEGSPWSAPAGDRERALAWVEGSGYATEARSVDYTTRVFRYRLWITTRSQDRDNRRDARRRLIALIETAQRALTQVTLGLNGVQPARTRVDTGEYEIQIVGPTASVELDGQVSISRPGRGLDAFDIPPRPPASQSLAMPHISSTASVFAPSLTIGAPTLNVAHLASAAVLYPPSLTVGPVALTMAHLESFALLFPPEIVPGGRSLALPHISSTASLFAPSLVPGAVALAMPHLASTAELFAPSLTVIGVVALSLPRIASTAVLHPPSLTVGAVDLTMPRIASTAVLYPPSLVPVTVPAPAPEPELNTADTELIGLNVVGGGAPYALEDEGFIAKIPASIVGASSTSYTVATWVTIPASVGWRSVRYTVLSVGEPGGEASPVVIDFSHDRAVRFTIRREGATNPSVTRSTGVVFGEPNLVVAVRDGADLRISINGSAFTSNTGGAGADPVASSSTWIGGHNGVGWPHAPLFGGVHRVMAWDRAFTADDVTALFSGGLGAVAGSPPVASPSAWIEPLTWRFTDQIDPTRVGRYEHFPLDGFARPTAGAFAGECHREQYATQVTLGGRTWTGSYATAPVFRDPPRRLDLAGVGSMASAGAALAGRTTWDWLAQGHFPTPSSGSESWYAEVDGTGAGLRISVRNDGRAVLTYLDAAGDTVAEAASVDSVYGRREITAAAGTNVTTSAGLTRQFTRAQLTVGTGHRFAANDLVRIEGDANFPDEVVLTETDPASGWVRFLIFGGHDQTLPSVGAEVVATGRIGVPVTTTGGSTDGYADDRQGWLPEPRRCSLRISRSGDVVTFAARGDVIGQVTVPSLPAGPSSGVTSYLGTFPDSAVPAATGELMRLATGEGWTASEIAAAEARAGVILTNRVAELDRRSYGDLSELPGLDREWIAHYPIETVFRDLDTGLIVGTAHETTGQSYGRSTGPLFFVELGARSLEATKRYQCEVTVYDRPFNDDFSPRTPVVLFHGAVATLERRPLDERWVTKHVDPTDPAALGEWNDGTDPAVPLSSATWAVRNLGIFTRVLLAPVDYVALGATNSVSGLDWRSAVPSRITGPNRLETASPTTYAEVGAWRLRAGNYALAIHDLSSVTESTFDGYVVQLGGAAFSSGSHEMIEVAHCRIASNQPHCRIFGSNSLALSWGGLDLVEHHPSATLTPVNSYGYYVERPVNHAAFNRMLIAIQNDTQHPLRIMGSHGLVLAHWPSRATTNYGASFKTITIRQQASLTNVHDMAYQGWNLWNSTEQWSTLPADHWRVERGHFGSISMTPASGMTFQQLFLPSSGNSLQDIPTVGEEPYFVTRRRNTFTGNHFGDTVSGTIARFDAWPTEGAYANRQEAASAFGTAVAPAVALAVDVGNTRVALQAAGPPLGGSVANQPIRLQWQRRPAAGGDWVNLDGAEGVGASYGLDRPGAGSWVYRTRTLASDDTVLATGTESSAVEVVAPTSTAMAIGINHNAVEYYSPGGLFTDAMRQATSWQLNGPTSDPADRPSLDVNGYPVGMGNLTSSHSYRAYPYLHSGPDFASGTYHLRFTGTGRVVVRHDGTTLLDTTESGTLHPVVINTPHDGGIEVRIAESDPVDYISQVQLFEPGQWSDGTSFATSQTSRPWSPVVVGLAAPFGTQRVMNVTKTNSQSLVSEWTDLPAIARSQTTSRGAHPEYAIRLAIQAGGRPWFCMPHMATNGYASNLGTLANGLLGTTGGIDLELSNEVWNFGFGQWAYFDEQRAGSGLSQRSYYAQVANARYEAFLASFGDRTRVRRVAAWQNMDPTNLRNLVADFVTHDAALRGGSSDGGFDLISAAPYFGRDFAADSTGVADADLEAFFLSWLPGEFDNRVGAAVPQVRADFEWQLGRTLDLVAYEAGQHLGTTRGGVLNAALVALQRSEVMYQAYLAYLTRMEALGWDEAILYRLFGEPGTAGAWGHIESLRADLAGPTAIKYRAARDFQAGARLTIGTTPAAPARPVWLGEDYTEVDGTAVIVDQGSINYAEVGTWDNSILGGYGGTSRYPPAGGSGRSATWSFSTTSGQTYLVMSNWSFSENRATNAPYTVLGNAGAVLAERRVNQRFAPGRYVAGANTWHVLAVVTADGPTLTVRLAEDGSDGFVIADAVRVVRAVLT